MIIKPILNRLLSVDEFYALSKNIKCSIDKSGLSDKTKNILLTRLNKNYFKLEEAIIEENKNPLIKAMQAVDQLRDKRFLGFRANVEALSYHWDANVSEAAIEIIEVIRRHGWRLYAQGYAKQTASVKSLLTELKKEPAILHIQKLDLQLWFNKLAESQTQYESTSKARKELKNDRVAVVTDLRKAVSIDLRAVLIYLESSGEFGGDKLVRDLIVEINTSISEVTAKARKRSVRRELPVE